jgi:hypothetical protein
MAYVTGREFEPRGACAGVCVCVCLFLVPQAAGPGGRVAHGRRRGRAAPKTVTELGGLYGVRVM